MPAERFKEAHETAREDARLTSDRKRRDEIIAAASSCPALDCGALVIDYRLADSVRPGHPEDWEFECSRCGMVFAVAQGELIFQSIPKQWLSANIHAA
jgi:hypothetical protein